MPAHAHGPWPRARVTATCALSPSRQSDEPRPRPVSSSPVQPLLPRSLHAPFSWGESASWGGLRARGLCWRCGRAWSSPSCS
eukprot:371779-Prymnesium_polylepis.1